MRRAWMREAAGWSAALAMALIVTAQVASSPRSDLLFRDGDSLVVALASRSLLEGQPWDWAMSSVLFLPEIAAFIALSVVLPIGVNGVLAAFGVTSLLGLYGAIRLAAGRRRDGAAPVGWSLAALAAFGAVAATEASSSRDALELASLQLTTTYYAATVIGAVATVGIVRRALDAGASRGWTLIALLLVALVSTLTNPLYAAWAVVPMLLTIWLCAWGRSAGRLGIRLAVLLTASLALGAALGFLARIPFSAWIANTGAGYAQPALWRESVAYYGDLVALRLSSPLGWCAAGVLLALLALAVMRTVTATDPGARLVAVWAWIVPVLVVVGAVALGTHAARYLQPAVFAPVLALVASPRGIRLPAGWRRSALASVAALLLAGAALSVPRLTAAAQRPDADLACVTAWVDASERTGAGQFWTVRLPKLHLADPAQLVQVDHRLDGYAWLVDRTDFRAGEVSFLVEDAVTVPWELPTPAVTVEEVTCGRYRILDFGDARLPIGPPHS